MSAPATKKRGRRRRGGAQGHEDDERWLLTYADMITLLMALFMVLFSISSVNTSKYESLQRTLKEAFSGKILPGGTSVHSGGSREVPKPAIEEPAPSIRQEIVSREERREALQASRDAARREEEDFRRLKAQIDAYARRNGLAAQIETRIDRRGLTIRLLTDKVLFESGEATIKGRATALLSHIGHLLDIDARHPVSVEGHTDDVPIHTARFPSNWELSGARASSVVRRLIATGVKSSRFEATGFADLHPIASNRSPGGRHRNRRVEIVLLRIHNGQGGPQTP